MGLIMPMTVKSALEARFKPGVAPRSDAYRTGFEMILRKKLEGAGMEYPYQEGSAESDAFLSGVEHGYDYLATHNL